MTGGNRKERKSSTSGSGRAKARVGRALYTPEQRARRDASTWTYVQAILAPLQFVVFLVSTGLVLRFLATGEGLVAAHLSVVAKTLALYAIMVTGSLWEKEVFGRYLLAAPFFWEDMVSFAVIALHTTYLVAYWSGALTPEGLFTIALLAYAAYAVNAGQFLWKFRQARLSASRVAAPCGSVTPAAGSMP